MRLDRAQSTARVSRWWWLGAGAALAAWIVTAFVLALPTGWVHVLLVAGVLAVVRAIVEGDRGRPEANRGDPRRG
jgi:hypothetical protein